MAGYTETLIYTQMAVGDWTCIYYYIIVFICTFFLQNLILAVINSKFGEEMQNKAEQIKVKKKKLDDAAESSEDEDAEALALIAKFKEIKESKLMSPRSKENLINKIKIEHKIWQVDTLMEKQFSKFRAIERGSDEEEEVLITKNKSQKLMASTLVKKEYTADKIGILAP